MLGGITLDIKLICDSLCDIPDEIMAKDYLEMIPLTLIMDGKEYKDGIDITKEEFYVKALEAKDIPKTSQATYVQFKDAFDRALAEGKKVLCIRSEEHTSELQSRQYLVCRLLLEKKKSILTRDDKTTQLTSSVA